MTNGALVRTFVGMYISDMVQQVLKRLVLLVAVRALMNHHVLRVLVRVDGQLQRSLAVLHVPRQADFQSEFGSVALGTSQRSFPSLECRSFGT